MGNHIFLISCGVATLYGLLRYHPLCHHVSQQSYMSQSMSHLWTLSKTSPIDVSWLGWTKPRSAHLGLGNVVIGQQVDALIFPY